MYPNAGKYTMAIECVVATQIFCFIPIWGFMIQFDEHIFQMGWFNHQLVECVVLFIPYGSVRTS